MKHWLTTRQNNCIPIQIAGLLIACIVIIPLFAVISAIRIITHIFGKFKIA
jgi:hypothetical protein